MPPKKSASAYIIFGKEVRAHSRSSILAAFNAIFNLIVLEKSRNSQKEPHRQSHRSGQGNRLELGTADQRGQIEVQRGC